MPADEGRGRRRPRLLVIAPIGRGGFGLATADVVRQLEARGWCVRVITGQDATAYEQMPPEARALPVMPPSTYAPLARLTRLYWQPWIHRPLAWLQRTLQIDTVVRRALAHPRRFIGESSASLCAVERAVRESDADVVLFFGHQEGPPGMTALLTTLRPRLVVAASRDVEDELRTRLWPVLRFVLHRWPGGSMHPSLLRRVAPHRLRRVVFASEGWRRDAVAVGVPAAAARTVYYGVEPLPPLPRLPVQGRLLFVGELAPRKGLHLLLPALAVLRRRRPDVTLTVVASPGPAWYRAQIDRQVRRLGIGDAVTILPSVPRDRLQRVYADHDVLLFYSPFQDPVGLALMEAYAAGLPVAASRAWFGSPLVRDQVTCLTFDPGRPATLTRAIMRLLEDDRLRQSLTASALQLVRTEFSLDAMGAAYDRILREQLP